LLAAVLAAAAADADAMLFEGTLTLNGLGSATVAATGTGVAAVNGSGGGLRLSSVAIGAGVFVTNTTSTQTPPPTTFPFAKIVASFSNAAGAFAVTPLPGSLRGPMALPGSIQLCTDIDCGFAFTVPFTQGGSNGVGIGGSTITAMAGTGTTISLRGASWRSGSTTISLRGASWRSGSSTIMTATGTHTSVGFVHGPASLTSSTALTGGVLQLVTPIAITANTPAEPVEIPIFGSLQLRLVPEPGAGAALLAGAVAIALLGRRNRGRA
jgi:hypothetical protein